MTTHRPEVADVFRIHQQDFMERWEQVLSPHQRRALNDIGDCRTAVLGGHVEECDQCGHRVISYNSCRNRHCPKCQAGARAKWLDERSAELLPVEYFHVVFTVPQEIASLALHNGREIYTILFRAASETLLTIAADPKHLGAAIGFLAVLHTWGQNLHLHPHLHCVAPGGGISPDGSRWIACRNSFFLPVKVLSVLFRKKFLFYLKEAYQKGKLRFPGEALSLANPFAFQAMCKRLDRMKWVVYAKAPFGGPEQVLKYLARYTHRVAISNSRLVSLEDGRVSFEWKDYADGNKSKIMTLDAVEFIRRFLLHILPAGFVRIRHFGFLANRVRKHKLAVCQSLLSSQFQISGPFTSPTPAFLEAGPDEPHLCPVCKAGRLVVIEIIKTDSTIVTVPAIQDTS